MLPEISIVTTIGIGDLILVKGALDFIKHNFSKITICPCLNLNEVFRQGSKEFDDCVKDLCSLFFSEAPYTLDYEAYKTATDADITRSHEIIQKYIVVKKQPQLNNFLCKDEYRLDLKNYVVINTKIRGYRVEEYKKSINNFLDSLMLMNDKYKIIILGERHLVETKEYLGISEFVYCIYDDLIKNLIRDNVYDLTRTTDIFNTPVLENIKKDCSIMANAHQVINLGGGGAFCMAFSVGKLISILDNEFELAKYKHLCGERFYLTNNMSDLCNKIRSI